MGHSLIRRERVFACLMPALAALLVAVEMGELIADQEAVGQDVRGLLVQTLGVLGLHVQGLGELALFLCEAVAGQRCSG